jgi:hypothetical protein
MIQRYIADLLQCSALACGQPVFKQICVVGHASESMTDFFAPLRLKLLSYNRTTGYILRERLQSSTVTWLKPF